MKWLYCRHLPAADVMDARYSRQIMLPEIGLKGQEKLGRTSALVVGAGGLGCPALLSLVLSGVGRVTIVDGDRVDISNLQRQLLFSEAQIGQNKAHAAAQQLLSRNSSVSITALDQFIMPSNARDILTGHDLILDGSDNFPTRYLLSDVASALGIPVVSGALHGFQAQVTVLNAPTANGAPGPGYRCLYPHIPQDTLNCESHGVLSSVAGWAGMIMANEALKLIIGHGQTLSGKIMLIDTLNNSRFLLNVERNPQTWEEGRKNGENPERVDYGRLYCQDKLEIDVQQLARMVQAANPPRLIDIRETHAIVPGLDLIHRPYVQIINTPASLSFDRELVLICDYGGLSLRLAQKLNRLGHRVLSLRGGFLAWSLFNKEKQNVS